MSVDIVKLIVSILICQLAGALGAIFTFKAIPTWYRKLKKPSFNPPSWIFGPVWTLLYLMMGISIAIVLSVNSGFFIAQKFGIMLFWIQLLLNVIWSILFFGLKKPGLAFLEIILLWITIAATIYEFFFVSSLAAWLLVPYLLWVSFASILNFYLWRLNK